MIVSYSLIFFSEKCKKKGNMRDKREMIECTYLSKSRKCIPSVDGESTKDKINEGREICKHF